MALLQHTNSMWIGEFECLRSVSCKFLVSEETEIMEDQVMTEYVAEMGSVEYICTEIYPTTKLFCRKCAFDVAESNN